MYNIFVIRFGADVLLTSKFFRSYSHASTTDAQQPNGNGAGVECINWGADLSQTSISRPA